MLPTLRSDPLVRMLGHTTTTLLLSTLTYYAVPLRFDRIQPWTLGRAAVAALAVSSSCCSGRTPAGAAGDRVGTTCGSSGCCPPCTASSFCSHSATPPWPSSSRDSSWASRTARCALLLGHPRRDRGLRRHPSGRERGAPARDDAHGVQPDLPRYGSPRAGGQARPSARRRVRPRAAHEAARRRGGSLSPDKTNAPNPRKGVGAFRCPGTSPWAVAEGFEPSVGSRPQTLSRRSP